MKKTLDQWRSECREIEQGRTGQTIHTDVQVLYSIFLDNEGVAWFVEWDDSDHAFRSTRPISGERCERRTIESWCNNQGSAVFDFHEAFYTAEVL